MCSKKNLDGYGSYSIFPEEYDRDLKLKFSKKRCYVPRCFEIPHGNISTNPIQNETDMLEEIHRNVALSANDK